MGGVGQQGVACMKRTEMPLRVRTLQISSETSKAERSTTSEGASRMKLYERDYDRLCVGKECLLFADSPDRVHG